LLRGGNVTVPESARGLLIRAAVATAIVCAAVALWNHQHRQLADAQRAREAAELKLKGQIVTEQETAKQLRVTVADLLAKNADLAKLYADAQKAAPGAKPLYAGTLNTGGLKVEAPPRAPQERPPAPATPGAAAPTDQPIAPVCVLADGDTASINVEQIALQTKDGNVLALGVGEAWRETPLPRAKLFGGPFKASVSDVSGLAPPSLPRWGGGIAAACLGFCAAGPAVAFPPLRIFSLQIETTAAGLVSDRGAGGAVMAIGRW
jgi:hypothetical protein